MTQQPLKSDLAGLTRRALGAGLLAIPAGPARDRAMLLALVDAVLKSNPNLPALPPLAEAHSTRMAERLRNPHGFAPDAEQSKTRARAWELWYSLVREKVDRDGVQLLDQLARLAPDDRARFAAVLDRVSAMLRALRDLGLPWWQSHQVERYTHRDLSLVDYCERRIAKAETWQIKRGDARGQKDLLAGGGTVPPGRADTQRPAREQVDEWGRAEALL